MFCRSGAIAWGEGHWGGFSKLYHHIVTDEDAFKSFSGGLNYWEYLELPEHAEEAAHFNRYMTVCPAVTEISLIYYSKQVIWC